MDLIHLADDVLPASGPKQQPSRQPARISGLL